MGFHAKRRVLKSKGLLFGPDMAMCNLGTKANVMSPQGA